MDSVELLREILNRLKNLEGRIEHIINNQTFMDFLTFRRQQSLEGYRRQYRRQNGISEDVESTNHMSLLKRTETPEGEDEID